MQTIPSKLSQLRQLMGLSQYQLAFFLGVSQPAYCHWETGGCQPSWKHLQTIANFYQLTLPDLLLSDTDTLLTQLIQNEALKKIRGGGG